MAATHQPLALSRRALTAALSAACIAAAPAAHADPTVVLYTMGPGDDVFSRFGHAAICVRDALTPEGRCFNYGTADFSTPAPLTWSILRGRGRFWVSVTAEPLMVQRYGPGEDRDLDAQTLRLDPAAARALVARLDADATPERREFIYHHYRDNCTTRIRDHLDAVTRGALSGAREPGPARTWRDETREGLATSLPLLVASDLLLGRRLDRPMTLREHLFLPRVFRAAVASSLAAPPERVWRRQRPTEAASPARARFVWLALAALAGALSALARRSLRRWPSAALLALLGAFSTLLWAFAGVCALPELHLNEALLLLWPSDLAAPWFGARGRARYGTLRLAGLGAAAVLMACGVLIQPLWGLWACVAAVWVGARLTAR